MQVRLADKSVRAIAVDLLVREWGDPIVVRSQFYPIWKDLRLCLSEIGRLLNW